MEIPWNSICKFIGILLEIIWNFYCKKTSEDLKFYNHELEYVCEPGEFEVMIGPNSRDVISASFVYN